MNRIDALFDRMDAWRHFPNYQLERRADLFFSLYVPEALEAKLGLKISDQIVPEFPVRIGTIYPDKHTDKSYKIDYLALSADGEKAILVELKTEGKSLRKNQDDYLTASRDAGVHKLLEGLIEIFRATTSKHKYFALLDCLGTMGLLLIPANLKDLVFSDDAKGADEASRSIEITARVKETIVMYIIPEGKGADIISFSDFGEIVRKHGDPVSRRFAHSIETWSRVEAGHPVDR